MSARMVRDCVEQRRGAWVPRGLAGPTSDELRSICRQSDWCFVEVNLTGITDKLTMMRALAEQLDFPDYFGANWNAVNDCLGDLGEQQEGVVLRLKGLGDVPNRLSEPFVEILDDHVTGALWGDDPGVASGGQWRPFIIVADPPLPQIR